MQISIFSKLKPRLFYGWWMVLAGFVIVAYGEGSGDYVSGRIIRITAEELGGNLAQVSFIVGLASMLGAASFLVIAPLIDRFGPRPLMLTGIALVGVGYLGLSAAPGLLPIYLLQGTLIGVGASAGFLLPVQTATANWFLKRRCMALALVAAAPVIGGALTLLFNAGLASQFPGRGGFLGLGLLLLVGGIPLALLMRHRPEQHGYRPDGQSVDRTTPGETAVERSVGLSEIIFTSRLALRTRAFWMLAIAMALGEGSAFIIRMVAFPILMDRGFPHQVASLGNTTIPLVGLVGILLFGYLGDRCSKRHLLAIAVASQSLSGFLLLVGGTYVQVVLYPLAFGLGSGMVPLLLAIRADYFGRQAFATVTVATMLTGTVIGIPVKVGIPFMSGWLQDTTGSLVPSLLVSALLGLVAAALFWLARRPELPQSSPGE